jgi:molecular chaperone GrpE
MSVGGSEWLNITNRLPPFNRPVDGVSPLLDKQAGNGYYLPTSASFSEEPDTMTESDTPPESAPMTPPSAESAESSGEKAAAKISELETSVAQLKDQLLRKAAEFENYKRRVEADYANVVKYSNDNLIARLLAVLDDFERFFKASREGGTAPSQNNAADTSFHRGMELIHQKLVKLLEAQGLQAFESVGKPFDPEVHDALLQVPNADVPPRTVLEEVEKGYRLHDRVIRHAKVVVSSEVEEETPSIEDLGVGD